MTDYTEQLLSQARTGDHGAVLSLVERYLPELHAFIRLRMGTRLGARETSEDLTQSVCREVLEKLDDFEYRGEPAFKRWLFLHAERKLASRGRFHAREKRDARRDVQSLTQAQDASGYRSFLTPSRVAVAREQIEGLERAFDKLSEDHREVLTCAKILGMSHAEISAHIGRSEGATRVLLNRAMVKLAFLLEGQ